MDEEKACAKAIVVVTKNGEAIPVDITASVSDSSRGKIMRTSLQDSAEWKRCEDEGDQAKEEMKPLVKKSTAELVPTNKQLQAGMEERKVYEDRLRKRRRELEQKAKKLTELNEELRILLRQRERDMRELEERVAANIKELVMPHMEMLKNSQLDSKSRLALKIMESSLVDVMSPFIRTLSSKYLGLTRKEMQVANLIRDGKETEEIAQIMNISDSAVKLHRYHIRRKLGLICKKVNLRAQLVALSRE
jgi:DNA-binding CsgD family transcriptional regulator